MVLFLSSESTFHPCKDLQRCDNCEHDFCQDMKESTDKEDSSKDENADEDDVAAAAPEEEDNAAGVPSGGEDDANKAGVSARGEDDANAAGVSSGGEDDDDYDEDDNEKGDDDAEAVNLVPETLQPDTLDHEEDLQNLVTNHPIRPVRLLVSDSGLYLEQLARCKTSS